MDRRQQTTMGGRANGKGKEDGARLGPDGTVPEIPWCWVVFRCYDREDTELMVRKIRRCDEPWQAVSLLDRIGSDGWIG